MHHSLNLGIYMWHMAACMLVLYHKQCRPRKATARSRPFHSLDYFNLDICGVRTGAETGLLTACYLVYKCHVVACCGNVCMYMEVMLMPLVGFRSFLCEPAAVWRLVLYVAAS